MTTLTPEQCQAISQSGDQPTVLVDPTTQTEYVVLKAEVYQRMKDLVAGPLKIEEQRAFLRHIGERAGWDDPAMDVYNDLDPRR